MYIPTPLIGNILPLHDKQKLIHWNSKKYPNSRLSQFLNPKRSSNSILIKYSKDAIIIIFFYLEVLQLRWARSLWHQVSAKFKELVLPKSSTSRIITPPIWRSPLTRRLLSTCRSVTKTVRVQDPSLRGMPPFPRSPLVMIMTVAPKQPPEQQTYS